MITRIHAFILAVLLIPAAAGWAEEPAAVEPDWTAVGDLEEFPQDEAVYVEDYRVYVIRAEDGVRALSPRCTHRGCTVGWSEGEFVCPCHQARFNAEGQVLDGPARDPLETISAKVEDGQVWLAP